MKIGIIGLNKVGLSFSLLCDNIGYDVIGFDKDSNLIFNLNSNKYPNEDNGLFKLLLEKKTIEFNSDENYVIQNSEIIFIFTSPKDNIEGKIDTTELFSIVNTFYELSSSNVDIHNKKLVICSLTNFGDSVLIYERLKSFNTQVAYNPHFIFDGNIIDYIKNSKIVIVGTESKDIFDSIVNIYSKIQPNGLNAYMMSLSSAEITRMAINSYSVINRNFSNMIGTLLGKSGLESDTNLVMSALNTYLPYQNNNFKYGFGVGGPVLPKDNRLLSKYIELLGFTNNIPKFMDEFNKDYGTEIKNLYKKINPDKSIPFVIDSLSYEKNKNSVEESQRLRLCIELLNDGYYVNVIENDNMIKELHHISMEYEGRLKFYTKETNPKGIKIDL
jgi:nucleotide sugar dehydrogenase